MFSNVFLPSTARYLSFFFFFPQRQCAKSRSHPRLKAAAGVWIPLDEWNCTSSCAHSEPAIGRVKTMCESLICHTWGMSLISHLRKPRSSWLESKLKELVSLRGSLEHWGNHRVHWLPHEAVPMNKELWCRHQQVAKKSYTTAKVCSCYMTA